MSDRLGTYSFLPWLRHGIAGSITAEDLDEGVSGRAAVHVDLTLRGDPVGGGATLTADVGRDIELYGPGDIVGIDPRAIVRSEPRNWITNFEPNYLAHVEFYDEDFPWRYTPAAPAGGGLTLRPWIALAVLADGEFEERADPSRPLPAIAVPDPTVLPDAADAWAWAHVHVNRDLAASEAEMRSADIPAVLGRLRAVLAENADLACSRLLCPRHLHENTAYHAFVVPMFESGRLAGLGEDPGGAPHATFSAWEEYADKPDAALLPFYHRWYFRTGTRQDFESLVRLLKPRTADPRVGTRDLDVGRPLAGLPAIPGPDADGVLRLGGALRVPRESLSEADRLEAERHEAWAEPHPHPFESAMAATINLVDDYAQEPAAAANAGSGVTPHPDPVITMPMYGRWHALQQRLLRERNGTALDPDDNWVHDLNLDPRHRVGAGFGTRVVQQNQEAYMDAAWGQLGEVLAANRKIRLGQLARRTGAALHRKHVLPVAALAPDRALALTAPVHSRIRLGATTLRHQRAASVTPPVLTSAALRRITRPRGPIGRLVRGNRPDDRGLVTRVEAGEIAAAPEKRTPRGFPTVERVTEALLKDPRTRGRQGGLEAAKRFAETLRDERLTPEAVRRLPKPGDKFRLVPRRGRDQQGPREPVKEAGRFSAALADWHALAEASDASAVRPAPVTLGVAEVASALAAAIDPRITVPARVLAGLSLPDRLKLFPVERFEECMAYPRIDLPMYEPLVALSSELFLPNLHLVEQNSITLLETNQAFVEAYMVGLNHEMARELLWREYPTDQRGSPFRQFWDVRAHRDTEGRTPDELREALYDIPELHRWPRRSDLGEHDHRELPGDSEEEVVLLIRGELIKKYPTAVIYAHRGDWPRKDDGSIDLTKERLLAPLTVGEEADPPRTKVRTPLYEGKVAPDVYLFGFDLTATAAKGGPGTNPTDDPGWFFVIEERPGEPRFGLDLERDGSVQTFNDLAWPDAGADPGAHLDASTLASVTLAPLGAGDVEKTQQRTEDVEVNPAPASAARWAYILYQAPVMVAIHAAEMLRPRP